jgi:signal transduction histidine kinase
MSLVKDHIKVGTAMSRSAGTTSERPFALSERYVHALLRYVFEPGESALTDAHDLGREALDEGLGVLAMAAMQFEGLAAVLARPLTDGQRERAISASQQFAVESLTSYEMAYRGYAEANRALHRLNDMLEGQARRIASTLHDEAGQLLASVHFALAEHARTLPQDRQRDIDSVRELLLEVEDRLRTLAHEVRPPVLSTLGLVAALKFLTTTAAKRWGLPVSVTGTVEQRLPPEIETAVYRVAQEAITNVARHAQAASATIEVSSRPGRLRCTIRDDGVGFGQTANQADGLGLVEIRERVGALGGTVQVGPNQPRGSVVSVELPLQEGGSR